MHFGPQIMQQPWHIMYHFKAEESEHHESAYNFQMKFYNLSFILWEQVSSVLRWKALVDKIQPFLACIFEQDLFSKIPNIFTHTLHMFKG